MLQSKNLSVTRIAALALARSLAGAISVLILVFVFSTDGKAPGDSRQEASASYIIQASSFDQALRAVQDVGGEVTHQLKIIKAVSAILTPREVEIIEAMDGLKIHTDRKAEVAGKFKDTGYPKVTHSNYLHIKGIDGAGLRSL